jgi:hypothetical protein
MSRENAGVLMSTRPIALPGCVVDAHGVEHTAGGILDAIRRWDDRYGEPPTVADWDPRRASRIDQQWRAERFHAGDWPAADTVRAAFRTFNAAVEAAGLTPRPTPLRARVRPPQPAPEASAASRLVAIAMAEAAADAGRPGAEQIADRLRAVSGARKAGDPETLRAELVRLAGSVLAWADALAPPTR